jgi:hypothetical protein
MAVELVRYVPKAEHAHAASTPNAATNPYLAESVYPISLQTGGDRLGQMPGRSMAGSSTPKMCAATLSHHIQSQWRLTTTKGHSMWALVIFTIATTGVASSTVTSLEFATQHLCLIAEQQLESLTEPVVSEGLVRYTVVGTCVQVSEASKKK